MNIRRISAEVLEKFPDLKQKGFRDIDVNFAYSFYIDEVVSSMQNNSDKIGVSFGTLGNFYLENYKLWKRLKGMFKISTTIDGDDAREKWRKKYDTFVDLINVKKKFLEEGINYIETYNDLPKTRMVVQVKKNEIVLLNTLLELAKGYDERVTARNLEKQITNTRGDKEPDL